MGYGSRRSYEPPVKTEAQQTRQKEIFLEYLPLWRKLSLDDVGNAHRNPVCVLYGSIERLFDMTGR